LLEELDRSRVSVAEVVPSFLFGLLAEKKQRGSAVNELAALRWMILTGEALSGEICREWFRRYPTVPLVNAYGPTECSDDITHFVTRTPPAARVVNTPIGRHLPNIQLYVLGDDWNPLPVGVTGELYAGGVGVGRGYLNDAEQTAKLCPPHPFSRKPGERLYRTGDLTRHLPTGDLEYLGRRDHQVKIRGFRIELGEIEAALLQCPAVEQCAVTSHEFMNGDKRLVAYIVPQAGSTSTPDEWRRFLRDRLPEYLIPSFFMTIARLPLTPNGKIDRKALPQPVGPSPESTGAYIPPQTEIEQLIAGIWQEVLEVEKVGRRDNFFDLGGHSLLMVQAHLKLRAAIKTEITLIEMFRYPTVASMAEYISNGVENKEHVIVQRAHNRAAARRESVSTRTSLRSRPN
jgi:acyl-coenzyme A synthetase/AMP-(fatty) acid ligase/acyl carrier protein